MLGGDTQGIAMRPLLQLQDEHVLATLSAVVLALKEGRTGLPIGGVFVFLNYAARVITTVAVNELC